MTPTEPTDPKGVTIGSIEAKPQAVQPSEKRGEATTVDVTIQYLEEGSTQSDRYRQLKDYQQYAGEASFGNLMGAKPHIREHPQDYWPVNSHVVPVVFGTEIYDLQDFWGLITGVDDSDTVIVGEAENIGGFGQSFGTHFGGLPGRSPNAYRLSIEIVTLADLDEYADREALFSDLSPVLNQM